MGALSDIYDNHALDALLGDNHSATWPTTVYIGYSSTAPAKDGTNVTEPTDAAYARQAVGNSSVNWPDAASGTKSNGVAIIFPTATADQGTILYWIMMDDPTAGNLAASGALISPVAVGIGITPDFPPTTLVIGAD